MARVQRRAPIALLALVLATAVPRTVNAIEAKCSACTRVAQTIESKVKSQLEEVRQPLDLRGRLDSQGVRYGKNIQYKDSELRYVELFEGICEDMKEFGLGNPENETTYEWMKRPKNVPSTERKHQGKVLSNYCYGLIEEHEEDLIGLIKEEEFKASGMETLLCKELTKACKPKKKAKGKTEL